MELENMRRSPLLVFADDWGRHPSSCQHLINQLLPEHLVLWVNTIGTRKPQLDVSTFRRGIGKVWQWLGKGAAPVMGESNPRVLNPLMWPGFGSPLQRRLNRLLLVHQLRKAMRDLPALPIAITTIPLTADLVGPLPVERWIYYCVDEFGSWPGLDQESLRTMEKDLVRRVDRIIAAGPNLRDHLAGLGGSACLLSHGVDLELWQGKSMETPLPFLSELPRPVVAFWGLLDRRMDVHFVEQLAADMSAGCIVLAGPENDADGRLRALPRVVLPGKLPLEQLPSLARAADVLIMPYDDVPMTRALQPLKLKEYLATGKPVVVRDLPGNREWSSCLDLASDAATFSRLVRLRLDTGLPSEQLRARARLKGESWQAKARAFQTMIMDQELPLGKCS